MLDKCYFGRPWWRLIAFVVVLGLTLAVTVDGIQPPQRSQRKLSPVDETHRDAVPKFAEVRKPGKVVYFTHVTKSKVVNLLPVPPKWKNLEPHFADAVLYDGPLVPKNRDQPGLVPKGVFFIASTEEDLTKVENEGSNYPAGLSGKFWRANVSVQKFLSVMERRGTQAYRILPMSKLQHEYRVAKNIYDTTEYPNRHEIKQVGLFHNSRDNELIVIAVNPRTKAFLDMFIRPPPGVYEQKPYTDVHNFDTRVERLDWKNNEFFSIN